MTRTNPTGTTQDTPDIRVEQRAASAPLATHSRISVCTSYPRLGTAVLVVGGEIDGDSLSRFTEVLDRRLNSMLAMIVVDLSAVTFLSISGLEALAAASLRARTNGTSLRLVVGTTPEVRRALHAGGLFDVLECHAHVAEALE